MNFVFEDYRIFTSDEEGNLLAEVLFPLESEGVVNINRTFVDPSLRGSGVAAKLLNLAYEHIKKQGLKAKPTCSYAVTFFKRNDDKTDILLEKDLDNVKVECAI
ncbi:MAG TPA: GNAT family N-acetyltransferase [Acholeplasma sp.]|nr:GNAT family N-acetyltransferase [Acholeplasma sp.]